MDGMRTLIGPTAAPVRGTRLAGCRRLAERLRKSGCGRWRGARAGGLQAARLFEAATVLSIGPKMVFPQGLGNEAGERIGMKKAKVSFGLQYLQAD
ncbi:hypothetical protein IVB38_38635 [Bradyrhizobium sp. 38]|nr:hypothetical protein [Bradyrhizobium sp. 38]